MSARNLSDDQITAILSDEYRRLHDISPHDDDEAKDLERVKNAVKIMKVLHAQNLAKAQGNQEILRALQTEIAAADLQLAKAEGNPYLTTDSPAVFCQRILDAQKPPESVPQISVEEALERLSKGKQ
jgi:monoamine oxidase